MGFSAFSILICSILVLMNVWLISGIKTCDKSIILSIYSNSCKFKPSHSYFQQGNYKPQVPTYEDAKIESEEVLEILTNGIQLIKELSQDRKSYATTQTGRTKKGADDHQEFRTNELPNSVEDYFLPTDLDLSTLYPGSIEAAKLWKRLMRAAIRKGGKIRRDVYTLVYKCCSHVGCTENDFVHLC